MWFVGTALEFRVKLHAYIEIMAGKLYCLHKIAVRGKTGENNTGFSEVFPEIVVNLVPVAVSLAYFLLPIARVNDRVIR